MRFRLFCKSFRGDLDRFVRLLDSAEKHSNGTVPLVLSIPRSDKALFEAQIGTDRVELLFDEDLLGRSTTQDWKVQQLVKLNAYKAGFAEAWLIVDSDMYFVRDFTADDFVKEDGRVAFVASKKLHMLDEEDWGAIRDYLNSDGPSPWRYSPDSSASQRLELGKLSWSARALGAIRGTGHLQKLGRIQKFFRRVGPELNFMPAAIWTQESLEAMVREFMVPRNLSFTDLIRYSPWECVWVGEWETWRGLPQRYACEPYFLHVLSDESILRARREQLTEAVVAQRYLGLQLAARHQELVALDAAQTLPH